MRGPATVTRTLQASAIAITVVWSVVVVVWREAPYALTFDDAWYYFGIARNVRDGAGSTFDGINPTNGYHPLWLAVCVVPFLVGLDDLDAARALLLLQVLIYGASLAVVARIVGHLLDAWPRRKTDREAARHHGAVVLAVMLALVAGNPFVLKTFVNGLESGIAVLSLAAILWIGVRTDGQLLAGLDRRARLTFGALLAVAFLSRTDAVFLLACVGGWLAVEWLRATPRPTAAVLQILVPPGAVALGYLIANKLAFGIWVQVSGLVKRADPDPARLGAFLLFAALAAVLQRHGFARVHGTRPAPDQRGRFPLAAAFVHRTAWFASSSLLLVAYYFTLQTQVWQWYFCPVVLYGIVLLPLAAADFVDAALSTAPKGAGPARALRPVWAALGIPLLVAFLVTGRQFADPHLRSIQVANADTGAWIREHVAEGDRLASWDAGALGYFSHRSIINIDGVVNSAEFRDAMAAGAAAQREFLRCRGLRYITNNGSDVDGEDHDVRNYLGALYGREVADAATIAFKEPFLYSGVTTGSGGADNSGLRPMAIYVYELPRTEATGTAGCAAVA